MGEATGEAPGQVVGELLDQGHQRGVPTGVLRTDSRVEIRHKEHEIGRRTTTGSPGVSGQRDRLWESVGYWLGGGGDSYGGAV